MKKLLIVVDMQRDFVDGSLGDRVLTSGTIDFKIAYRVPGREKKIREYI